MHKTGPPTELLHPMKTHRPLPVRAIELLEARIAPATFRWSSPGGGNWNDQNNWFNETTGLAANGFPNAADDVAKFTNANTAGATVTIPNVNITVGSILFDDNHTYLITSSGAGQLTLSSTTGQASITVSNNNGDAAHTINTNIVLSALVQSLLITDNTLNPFTLSGQISEVVAGTSVTKAGKGTTTFAGGAANTYTGNTTVQDGTLFLQKSTNVAAFSGPVFIGGAGHDATLNVNNASQLPDTTAVIVNAQGTAFFSFIETIGSLTINDGTVSLGSFGLNTLTTSSLTMNGGKVQMNFVSEVLALTGDVAATSTASGSAQILGGTLNLGAAQRSFNVSDGPQDQDLTITSVINGNNNVGLTKTGGTGTMRLGGPSANTYNGQTNVFSGTLELAKLSGNAILGTLLIGDAIGGPESAVIRLFGVEQIGTGSVQVGRSGLLDLNGFSETITTLQMAGHVTTGAVGGATFTIQNSLTLLQGHLTAGAAGSVVVLPTVVTINSVGPSVMDGAGSFSLTGATNLGVLDSPADVDLLVTAPITGAFGLNKTGFGTLELDAVNTYTGGTLFFTGLIVNGQIGAVSFGSSQTTLSGTGTVGNVTLDGGALRPGNGPGVLHTGSIANGVGDTFYFQIDGTHPGNGAGFHDQIAITGTVNLNSVSLDLDLTNAAFAPGDKYVLINNDGADAVVGAFTGLPEASILTIGGRRYILTYQGGDGNDVVLTPEQAYIIDGDTVPGSNDFFTVARDATVPFLVHVTQYVANIAPLDYTVNLHEFANLEVHGGGGDDFLSFNATNGYFTSAFPNVLYALNFLGGSGTNSVQLTGGNAGAVSIETYSSTGGPDQGFVFFDNGFWVSFDETANFLDEIPVGTFVATGSGSGDTFFFKGAQDGTHDLVGLVGHIPATVLFKPQILLNGQGAGGDTFNIGPAALATTTGEVNVNTSFAQAGLVNVFGTGGDDHFVVTNGAPAVPFQAHVHRDGQPELDLNGLVKLSIDGGAGDDLFSLPGRAFDATITSGPGADTLTFASATSSISLNLDQPGVGQTLNALGAQLTLMDTMENVVSTVFGDHFFAKPSLVSRTLSSAAGPVPDTLVYDAQGAAAVSGAGTITTPGFADFTVGATQVTLLNVPPKPVLGTQGNTFAAPLDFAAGKGSVALAVGDLNGDGLADFVTADSKGGTVSIALSTVTGLLVPAVQKASGGKKPSSVVLGNFDGVNGLDIAVTNAGSGTVGIFLNDGAGNFGTAQTFATGKAPGLLRMGNFDADADLDLAMITAGNKITVLKNDGTGTFTASPAITTGAKLPKDLQLADLDGDSDLDLAVLHAGGQLVAQLNDGTGAFTPQPMARLGAGATALAIADFNGDGKLDAAAAHSTVSRFVAVALGQGTGAFLPMLKVAYPLSGKASALVASDFDGDGVADLAVANGAGGRVSILRGLGNGAFVRALTLELEDTPARKLAALALGDFNGDGRTDLAALSNASSEVSVVLRA